MKATFTGFSTVGSTAAENFKLHDLALIRQDLLNHFHTVIGERVMRPEYGCRIWDWLMEPFTATLRGMVVAEATRICESDPRVSVVSVQATSLDHAIRVELTLNYIPFDSVDQFIIDFENRQSDQGF